MNHREITLSICKALNIPTARTKRVVIELDATDPPLVTITRFLPDKWEEVIELFDIVPRTMPEQLRAHEQVAKWFAELRDKYEDRFSEIDEDVWCAMKDLDAACRRINPIDVHADFKKRFREFVQGRGTRM